MKDQRINNFFAVCIGFRGDASQVKLRFKDNVHIFSAPYFFSRNELNYYDNIIADRKSTENHCNIMIGHSAYPFLNHKKMLNKLTEFKHENMTIYLPLSYGIKAYASEVGEYAKSLFGDKVVIIDSYMNFDEYAEFLSTIDIAIFDNKRQTALSNIFILLYFNASLFFNSKGYMAAAMGLEGIDYGYSDKINEYPFEQLCEKNLSNQCAKNLSSLYLSYSTKLRMWNKMFEQIQLLSDG